MDGYKTQDCRLQHKALCTLLCRSLLYFGYSFVRRLVVAPFAVLCLLCAVVVAPSLSRRRRRRCCFRSAVVFCTFVSCAASYTILQHHYGQHQQIQFVLIERPIRRKDRCFTQTCPLKDANRGGCIPQCFKSNPFHTSQENTPVWKRAIDINGYRRSVNRVVSINNFVRLNRG